MKISLIQMNSIGDKDRNLAEAKRLVEEAAGEGADLIVLPEYYAYQNMGRDNIRANGETFPNGPSYQLMSGLAATHDVTIHAGSVIEQAGNSFYNTSVVFDPKGREIARYRKMHLFDVDVPGGASHRESNTVSRGEQVVTYKVGDLTVGCAICYDLRFPELFRALRDAGADIIALPASFTLLTGKDHWEVLCRARAIETQTYFLAVGQVFTYAEGQRSTWGHTMIIDPWGHVVAQASDKVGVVTGTVDPDYTALIRQKLPVANHHVLGTP